MSLIPINLGPGLAPDVTIIDGLVYVAWGTEPSGLQLAVYTPHGVLVEKHTLADGFFDSFPRFDREWLVYKSYPAFAPVVLNVRTGESRTFAGKVDGNLGAFVDATREQVAWQTATAAGYPITVGSLLTGAQAATPWQGAPDGIERFTPSGSVLCWKDIRLEDPSVGGYPSHAGDLAVGQYGYGIGVRLGSEPVRWLLGGSETMWPRCAAGSGTYAIACWGTAGVRLVIASRAELQTLPLTPKDDAPPPPVTPPKPVPPIPQPKPEPKPMPYDVNAPQTWTDAELSRRVDAEIALARSTDSPQYWKDMIRAASRGADWGYWVHRIQTGDGVGKAGPAPAPAPPPAPAPSIDPALLEQLAEVIGAVKLLQAEMLRAGARIALKTDNGHYLCAENGGGGDLNASRESAGGWETFTVEAQ